MGYQALLFCPDEKTARTVTQVLNELEFSVEPCIEPFAAVKKLMGQHFDAVVVDCDNEQNATLLFKSARNSSSNQTSLAVAVVEGQAGVAKAFRIGANLVLTKPINIEQAKGTLRVARGLLRKAEPGKPGVPAASAPAAAAPTPGKPAPAPAKPISAVRPATPPATPKPTQVPVAKPAPAAWPAAVAASSAPVQNEPEPIEISNEPAPAPIASAPAAAPVQQAAPEARTAAPAFGAATGGAASAPAPARKAPEPLATEQPLDKAADALFEKPATTEVAAPVIGSAPSFSFGGATSEAESAGGKKKIFIGVAAAVVLVGAIVGYTQLKGHSSAPATTTVATAPAPVNTQPAKPSAQAAAPGANPVSAAQVPTTSASDDTESAPQDITLHSSPATTKTSKAAASGPSKNVVTEEDAPAPLVVRGGKASGHGAKSVAAEVAAPSLAGMAPGTTPPPSFVPTTNNAFKPVLQTLNISQGVSQGLLLKKVSPSYPPNALRMRIEGTVELLATVSKDGNISRVKVVSGDSQLTKAASDAVKQWKYKPYLLNGEPVEIQTQITVNFKLPK
jgi:TonB family protein